MVASDSVTTPANGPKPNSLTKKIARMISWKLRDTARIAAAKIVDRRRRDVFGGADAHRNRNRDADHRGDNRHPDALENALGDFVPATGEVGREERGEEPRAARQALPDADPIHLGRAQRQRQVGGDAETDRPAQPRALDRRRLLPAAGRDRNDAHVNPAIRSRCGWRLSSEITLLASCVSSSSSALRIVADQSSSP